METNILFSLLIGSIYVSGSMALFPILGDVDPHPLFIFSPEQMISLFEAKDEDIEGCLEGQEGKAMDRMTEAVNCMAAAVGSSAEEPSSYKEICRYSTEFSMCFHSLIADYTMYCNLSSNYLQFFGKSIILNNKVVNVLCDEEGEIIQEYEKYDGFKCASEKQQQLTECRRAHRIQAELGYSEENCKSAYDFKDCVAEHMSECSEIAGFIIQEIMGFGLDSVCQADADITLFTLIDPMHGEDKEKGRKEEHDKEEESTTVSDMGMTHGRRKMEDGKRGKKGKGMKKNGVKQMMEKMIELLENNNKGLEEIVVQLKINQQIMNKIANN